MDQLQQWWTATVRSFLGWVAIQWDGLVRGLVYEWDVNYFIFLMGGVVIIGMWVIWRRSA